ncbi:hypothetical protein ACT6QH_10985 [Xanthobacter sp. TB0139]|uniref:hypothetical protein n=1 Tax=Xanthobacter sp. TB0139 TaxID=3459178 RepID=UPI00403A06E7
MMNKAQKLLIAGCVAALAGLGAVQGALAQTMPSPAETDVVIFGDIGAVKVLTYPARFVSANLETREAVFESADGKRWEIVVPPGVADLAALQNSEKLTVRLLPAVVTNIAKAQSGKPGEVMNQTVVNDGLPGLPEGYGLLSVTLTTPFIGIEPETGSITFEGPDGQVRTMRVFDAKVLQILKTMDPGDLAQISYMEGLSITTP